MFQYGLVENKTFHTNKAEKQKQISFNDIRQVKFNY